AFADVLPDEFHGLVGDCNTTVGPIAAALFIVIVWLAVDHDIAAGVDMVRLGPGAVARIRVGNVDRQMVQTVRIAPIEDVGALGGALIAALTFTAQWLFAEADGEAFDDQVVGV